VRSEPAATETARKAAAAGHDAATRRDLTTLARGGMLNLVGVVVNTVFNFLLVIVVTRGLGGTATGIFFESIALFHIAATAAQWGADVGIVRAIPRYRALGRMADVQHSIRAALIPATLVGIAFSALLFALAGPLGRLLTNGAHGGDLTPAIRVLAPFLPISAAYTVSLAVTRGFGTMIPSTLIDRVGKAIAQPLFVFLIVLAGLSSTALSVAWATPLVLGLTAALVWSRLLLRRSLGEADDDRQPSIGRRAVFREFWLFTTPRGLASMFSVMILWLDTLLVGALKSSAEAGVYAAATRYLSLGQFIGVAIAQVVGPKLSEVLASNQHERARSVYATATWWLMALAWPLYLTMIVLAPTLLSVFGPGFERAQPVMVILGSSMLVATLVGPVDIVLLMAGKSSWNLLNTIAAVTANVVLNLLLIPRFGITGAAVAWSASIILNNLLPLLQTWRIAHLHPFGRGSVIVTASSVVCFGGLGLVGRQLFGDGLAGPIAAVLAAVPIYLAVLWRFREPLQLSVLREALRRRGPAIVDDPVLGVDPSGER
jgi:O-antigen/teichoic acid export membrane protein